MNDLRLAISVLFLCLAPFAGCTKSDKAITESVQPAKVEKLPLEADLATIHLTVEADRRLGITTTEVTEREVTQRRTLGGQAVVPSGRSIIVSAPLPGIITRAGDAAIPIPGTKVDRGTPLLWLTPLLSAERDVPTPAEQIQLVGARANLMTAQTVAAGDVQRSKAEVEGARIALDRAAKLFADRAGARRAVDDAEAQHNIAKSQLEAAEQREKQLAKLLEMLNVKSTKGEATPLSMTTPIAGLVNRIDVREGQTVSTGSMLFEVVNTDSIWIRVPVFVDLLSKVQTDQPAKLVLLSGESLRESILAKPIAAPPTADAMTSSADLYYEIDNRSLGLRPGQRIGVELPMSRTERLKIVPAASVLYDVYGNTWVYTETGEQEYTRSRVSIRLVDGEDAVLASGPKLGMKVVADRAAELFGTEFGVGK